MEALPAVAILNEVLENLGVVRSKSGIAFFYREFFDTGSLFLDLKFAEGHYSGLIAMQTLQGNNSLILKRYQNGALVDKIALILSPDQEALPVGAETPVTIKGSLLEPNRNGFVYFERPAIISLLEIQIRPKRN